MCALLRPAEKALWEQTPGPGPAPALQGGPCLRGVLRPPATARWLLEEREAGSGCTGGAQGAAACSEGLGPRAGLGPWVQRRPWRQMGGWPAEGVYAPSTGVAHVTASPPAIPPTWPAFSGAPLPRGPAPAWALPSRAPSHPTCLPPAPPCPCWGDSGLSDWAGLEPPIGQQAPVARPAGPWKPGTADPWRQGCPPAAIPRVRLSPPPHWVCWQPAMVSGMRGTVDSDGLGGWPVRRGWGHVQHVPRTCGRAPPGHSRLRGEAVGEVRGAVKAGGQQKSGIRIWKAPRVWTDGAGVGAHSPDCWSFIPCDISGLRAPASARTDGRCSGSVPVGGGARGQGPKSDPRCGGNDRASGWRVRPGP